jgi:hypothetical protein
MDLKETYKNSPPVKKENEKRCNFSESNRPAKSAAVQQDAKI